MILQSGLTDQFLSTISPRKMKETTKGRLIPDRGRMSDHSKFIISSAATSKLKIRFGMSKKIGLILRVYNMKIASATNPFLMKFNPSSGFLLKYLEITVNQLVAAKSRAN